jgi:anti-sigma B factor antagonist
MPGISSQIACSTWTDGKAVIVTLPAEIDVDNQSCVQKALGDALETVPSLLVADGTATTFCASSGIGALLRAHEQASAAGTQLRVVVSGAAVQRVLDLTGADDILRLYPSLPDALATDPDPH